MRDHITWGPATKALVVTLLSILSITSAAAPVLAGAPGHRSISRGAVMSAFETRTTGGYLNMLRGHTVAAPVRGLEDGRISFFQDGDYCSTDWHYLGVTLLRAGGHRAASSYLRQTSISFAIDGSPVEATMSSSIKPFVGTGIHGQWGISVGKLIPPGTVADGSHTLTTVIHTPDFDPQTLVVTFTLNEADCGS